MLTAEIQVINKLGLHARAAAKLVNLASTFGSDIKLSLQEQSVDAKSIMGIMILAAAQGSNITVSAEGEDEAQALQQICGLFNKRFGEPE